MRKGQNVRYQKRFGHGPSSELHFNWLLGLPCNLKFSKLREYDSVVFAKVKPILRASQHPRNVILPGKNSQNTLLVG